MFTVEKVRDIAAESSKHKIVWIHDDRVIPQKYERQVDPTTKQEDWKKICGATPQWWTDLKTQEDGAEILVGVKGGVRRCRINWTGNEKDRKSSCNIYILDEPIVKRELTAIEKAADDDFERFCKAGDWASLIRIVMDRPYRSASTLSQYSERIAEHISEHNGDYVKNCEKCGIRFACMTK